MGLINFNKKIIDLLCFFSLFLLTTLNHSFIPWILACFFFVAFFLLRPSRNTILLHYLKGLFIGLFVITLYGLKFWFYDNHVDTYFVNSFVNKFLFLSVVVLAWVTLLVLVKYHQIIKYLPSLIVIHVMFFYIQILVYYSSGYFIDYVLFFTGEESRYSFFEQAQEYTQIIRPTGFYVEPSTYTGAMTCLLGAYLITFGKKFNLIVCLVLLSMVLSMSTSGIIIAGLFTGYLLVLNISGKKIFYAACISFLVFLLVGTLWFDVILEFATLQINKFERGYEARAGLTSYILNREGVNFLVGMGPFSFEKALLAQLPITGDSSIVTLNDSGVVIFLMIQFGILGLLLFLCGMVIQITRKKDIWIFLIVSLCKIAIYHPVFILYVAITLSRRLKKY